MSLTETLGLIATVVMVGSYALEERSSLFVATFALGCALAAFYAFLIGSIPFLIAEAIWAVIALRRFIRARAAGR